MHIARDIAIITKPREDDTPEHRVFAVFIELPFTIECQDAPATGLTYVWDDENNCEAEVEYETTIKSWGVWDHRVCDWAGEGEAIEFRTRAQAFVWLNNNINRLLT